MTQVPIQIVFLLYPLDNLLLPVIAKPFICLLPLASMVMMRRSLKVLPKDVERRPDYNSQNISSLWKVMLGISLYGFLLGLRKGMSLFLSDTGMNIAFVSLGLATLFLLLLWLYFIRRSIDFFRLFQVFLILFATGFLLIPFLDEGAGAFLSGYLGACSILVKMLIIMMYVDIACHSDIHPFVIVGIGEMLYGFTRPWASGFSMHLIGLDFADPLMALVLFAVYLIVLAIAFLLSSMSPGVRPILADMFASRPEVADFRLIDRLCDDLGKEFGLTAREIEVMQYTCKGRSKAYIAETLFISENTVRGYVRNIYTKLSVHNRQELLNAIGID